MQTAAQDLPAWLRPEILSLPCLSVSHPPLPLLTFCGPLGNVDTRFIPRVTHLCSVTPRGTRHPLHQGIGRAADTHWWADLFP